MMQWLVIKPKEGKQETKGILRQQLCGKEEKIWLERKGRKEMSRNSGIAD